jgi:Ca-activated chloride channel family protein
VNPDDVARVAEEEGIPVYIIATKVSNNASENAFSVLADSSGGKLFLAPNQPSQMQAFRSITEDIKHTYTLTYRSSATGISGWRHIQLEVLGDDAKDFKVTSRTGYWANHQLGD